jgi:hypothetical protein
MAAAGRLEKDAEPFPPPLATLPPRPFGFRDVIDRCKNYARIKGCWPRLFIGGRIFATNTRIASWIISGLIV